jgi:zinc protease
MPTALAASAICDPDWGSLRRELVIERKLAVSASCGADPSPDYGRLVASARADKSADAAQVSRAMVEHIEAAAARGASPEQFERARQRQLNDHERLLSSHEAAAELASAAEVAGDWRLMFWENDLVRDITLDEANAALATWTVATNRADVLLRHADAVTPLAIPEPLPACPWSRAGDGPRWPRTPTPPQARSPIWREPRRSSSWTVRAPGRR